jgi:hypothetical protein
LLMQMSGRMLFEHSPYCPCRKMLCCLSSTSPPVSEWCLIVFSSTHIAHENVARTARTTRHNMTFGRVLCRSCFLPAAFCRLAAFNYWVYLDWGPLEVLSVCISCECYSSPLYPTRVVDIRICLTFVICCVLVWREHGILFWCQGRRRNSATRSCAW